VLSIAVIFIQAVISASKNTSLTKEQEQNWKYRALIIFLHIIQPLARLRGRIIHGLTPWRMRGAKANPGNLTFFKPKTLAHWSEGEWKSSETWLEEIEQNIIKLKARVKRGGDFDKWDIQTKNGLFSTAKGILTIEEHGADKQYVKLKYWSQYALNGIILTVFLAVLSVFAALDNSWIVSIIFGALSVGLLAKYVFDSASVVNCLITAFKKLSETQEKASPLRLVKVEEPKEAEYPSPGAKDEADESLIVSKNISNRNRK